ncbi:hypothetical protein CORC01_08849 [Colletotrichum orchidophilum]|uniref:Heterokaryon incompatibility domain-containing protein n=1 Tax=Colletotrichum orchidophilum TaxID=1209926 RepID=A0A1G4B3I5_9PEZI|nr:uncharacterized protein CORC01_08849 [Colletotrichum orchidophilum]OHE95852.1 hypothetical protein CORC01_08849 [Colletotrichum orchidophilum]
MSTFYVIMESQNHYTDLKRAPSPQIRLLKIEAAENNENIIKVNLHTKSMKEAPGFNALSYAWGDKDQTTSILLNGLGFEVTNNLHAALKVLRSKTNNSFLWVDAICVNQKDDYERSHQVSLMTRIYSKARIVLCWLGPDVDDHSILPFLRGCVHHADTLSSPQAFASKSDAIRDILSRPYWSRLWVVQENVLAKERLFLCESNEISSEDLARSLRLLKDFVQLMASEFHGREVLQAASDIRDFHGTRMVDGTLMPSRQPQSHTIAEQFTLLNEMMIETSRFNATDPCDYLYGVLGLFPDTTVIITPDYTKSPAEVFKDFALLTLKKNFGLIAQSGTGHKNCTRMRRSCKEVPSWVPNHSGPFVEIHNGVSLLTSVRIAKFEAGTFFPHGWDLSQDNMVLRVKGVRVGRVISRSSPDTLVAKRLVSDWKPNSTSSQRQRRGHLRVSISAFDRRSN